MMKLALVLSTFLVLVSCMGKPDPTGFRDPGEGQRGEGAQDIGVALKTVATGAELLVAAGNSVTLTASKADQVLRASYQFNSGAADSLSIVALKRATQSTNCSSSEPELLLSDANDSRAISLLRQTALTPNTDYTVEISVKTGARCDFLRMDVDPLVWLGQGTERPAPAWSCDVPSLAVFVGMSSAYTAPGATYLGHNRFCGLSDDVVGATERATDSGYFQGMATRWTNERVNEKQERMSFDLTIDPNLRKARLTCRFKSQPETHRGYDRCAAKILDRKVFDSTIP